MSVVVKGLKLENNHLDGYVDVRIHYRDGAIYATIPIGERPYYKRLEVVELPDHHGRLVDADADSLKNKLKFINEAEHQIYGRGSCGFTAKCIHAIDDAPTVIEAEDGE